MIFNKISKINLISPENGEKLVKQNNKMVTETGNISYNIRDDGKIDFLGILTENSFKEKREFIDKVKAIIKNISGSYYNLIKMIISPVMPAIDFRHFRLKRSMIYDEYASKEIVINVGSGNSRIGKNVINIDLFDYPGVDIIADCSKMIPFPDNSVDSAVNMAVLEHIKDPEAIIKEIERVLKPGGIIITGAPFMEGFHGSPFDFTRWTNEGLKNIHEKYGFKVIELIPYGGPTSTLIWVLIEWLSIVLSFNTIFLYHIFYFLFSILLCPIKLFDLILVNFEKAYKINSFNILIAKKRTVSEKAKTI